MVTSTMTTTCLRNAGGGKEKEGRGKRDGIGTRERGEARGWIFFRDGIWEARRARRSWLDAVLKPRKNLEKSESQGLSPRKWRSEAAVALSPLVPRLPLFVSQWRGRGGCASVSEIILQSVDQLDSSEITGTATQTRIFQRVLFWWFFSFLPSFFIFFVSFLGRARTVVSCEELRRKYGEYGRGKGVVCFLKRWYCVYEFGTSFFFWRNYFCLTFDSWKLGVFLFMFYSCYCGITQLLCFVWNPIFFAIYVYLLTWNKKTEMYGLYTFYTRFIHLFKWANIIYIKWKKKIKMFFTKNNSKQTVIL